MGISSPSSPQRQPPTQAPVSLVYHILVFRPSLVLHGQHHHTLTTVPPPPNTITITPHRNYHNHHTLTAISLPPKHQPDSRCNTTTESSTVTTIKEGFDSAWLQANSSSLLNLITITLHLVATYGNRRSSQLYRQSAKSTTPNDLLI
ncbi:hypothetical protein ACFE04_000665 [Oxalis oulophora]